MNGPKVFFHQYISHRNDGHFSKYSKEQFCFRGFSNYDQETIYLLPQDGSKKEIAIIHPHFNIDFFPAFSVRVYGFIYTPKGVKEIYWRFFEASAVKAEMEEYEECKFVKADLS